MLEDDDDEVWGWRVQQRRRNGLRVLGTGTAIICAAALWAAVKLDVFSSGGSLHADLGDVEASYRGGDVRIIAGAAIAVGALLVLFGGFMAITANVIWASKARTHRDEE